MNSAMIGALCRERWRDGLVEFSKTRYEKRDGRSWIRVIDQMPMRHRYLHFGTSIQGVLALDDVANPVLEYIALMSEFGKKLIPEPDSVLIGGLGACGLWHSVIDWCGKRCRIEVVESNALVLELAGQFFRFEPPEEVRPRRLRETLALDLKKTCELVFVDCYNARFMPAELLSVEFMKILRRKLTADGAAVLNLWNPKCNKICGHQIRSMLQVFGHVGVIAGKEDDNFAVALPMQWPQKGVQAIILKRKQYPVTWIHADDARNWPDYLMETRPIYDGNVWQFMRQLRE